VLPIICIALVLRLRHATGGARVLIRTCCGSGLLRQWAEFQHNLVDYATDQCWKRHEACINGQKFSVLFFESRCIYRVAQKVVHFFQDTITLELFKIKWNIFYQNVPRVSENKDWVVAFMQLLNILCKLAWVCCTLNTVTNSWADDFFCNSYVKYYAVLVTLSININILKYFPHVSPYLIKLDTFEMTDIP